MTSSFQQRKNSVLSKLDKSNRARQSLPLNRPSVVDPKKSWDEKIIELCEKLNSKENYYTTSSCAGRIVLIIDQEKKAENLFVKVWHDLISFEELKESLLNAEGNIKFKMESCILHVACESLEDAQKLLDNARKIGWKRSGIISSENKFVLELNSTEKIEFPIIRDGKLLVDDKFLKIIVDEANEKLKKSWKKIEKLVLEL